MAGQQQTIEIEGKTLTIKNLDKVFYPAAGFTKARMIDYYIRVSKVLLPHFKNRPVTLKRYPDGIDGKAFYEKDAPKYTPEWVKRFPVPRRAGGTPIQYILVNDLPTLVWCASIATIEFHPFLHRAPDIGKPTEIVFDLDPGEGFDVLNCAEVGFMLREALDALGLKSFPKVSGSKGIQVYVPLNTPATYDKTRSFARKTAQLLEKRHLDLIVSEMAKAVRTKRIFIDWSQNSDFKTTVGVYSIRTKRPAPFVSLPVTWEELEKAHSTHDASMLDFRAEDALKRLERVGDLFAPVLEVRQKLPKDLPDSLPVAQVRAAQPPRGRSAKAKMESPNR